MLGVERPLLVVDGDDDVDGRVGRVRRRRSARRSGGQSPKVRQAGHRQHRKRRHVMNRPHFAISGRSAALACPDDRRTHVRRVLERSKNRLRTAAARSGRRGPTRAFRNAKFWPPIAHDSLTLWVPFRQELVAERAVKPAAEHCWEALWEGSRARVRVDRPDAKEWRSPHRWRSSRSSSSAPQPPRGHITPCSPASPSAPTARTSSRGRSATARPTRSCTSTARPRRSTVRRSVSSATPRTSPTAAPLRPRRRSRVVSPAA